MPRSNQGHTILLKVSSDFFFYNRTIKLLNHKWTLSVCFSSNNSLENLTAWKTDKLTVEEFISSQTDQGLSQCLFEIGNILRKQIFFLTL